jgi:hypothetical protein
MATGTRGRLDGLATLRGFSMIYRTLTTVFTAAALICAPTAGFAQSAPEPAASYESGLRYADGDEDDDDLVWYILGGVAVVVLVFLLFLDDDDDEDFPVSP